jgi:putative transferase (TIGR04331 family)
MPILQNTNSDAPELLASTPGELHLTSIEGAFDKDYDVALGPHCFIGRDEVFPKWQNLVFAEPFPDEATMEMTEKNLRGLVNYLLPGITDKLNAYHSTSYSTDFWRVLVLPWLIELVQKTWTSYTRLSQIIDQCGDRTMTVKICRDGFDRRFDDTVDFFNTMLKDYQFNWWIDSRILTALAPTFWCLQPAEPVSHPAIGPAKEPPSWQAKNRFHAMLRNIKFYLGYLDIPGLRWGGLFLSAYVNLLPKNPSRMRFYPDPDFHPEIYFPDTFLRELSRLMEATMPESFLKDFPALALKARRFPRVPGRLRLGSLSHWNEQEKVITAFAKEAGEKQVNFQHGGEYGVLKYNMMYNEMEGNLCTFVSWGWSYGDADDNLVISMPSPLHSKLTNTHKRKNNSIICVGGCVRLHLNRIHWVNQINSPVRYCNETIRFLEELEEPVRADVIFRPYVRAANDIEIADAVSVKFPNMPMLSNDLHAALMDCRLVFLYCYNTTMNLAMAANVPTIVLMPPDLMTPREEAEPFFSQLRRCGVIHDSPESAAKHLNQIWTDIEGWWSSSDVQEARKIWTHQFARTDRFWWWHWMKALASMKDVG